MTGPSERAPAYAALVTVQLLFATLPVAGKLGLEALHPTVFVAIRISGAALLLVGLERLVHASPMPSVGDLGRLAVYSLFGIVLNQVLFIWGLSLSTAVNAALLLTTIPVFTYAIAVSRGEEVFTGRRAAGIALALSGVVVLQDPRAFSLADDHVIGNALILVNALSYSLYLVISRRILTRIRPLTVTAWVFIFGTIMVVPLALFQAGAGPAWTMAPDTASLMLYVVLGPTVAVYALNLFALSRVRSSTVAVFIYLQPITAVLLAAWILDEAVPTRTLVAGALVFAGVALVTLGRDRRATRPPAAPDSSGESS